MLRCPWSVLFSNSSRLRVCSVNSNISWLWFHLSLTHFFKYRKEIQVLDYVLEFWRGSSNHSMLVLNWARTGSQNFVSCCQNVALLVPLHWWWWWRWWWLLSTDDDEIFIKFPPHANQLAQDHLPWSRWSERDIGEKFKRKQTNFEIQFDMGMDVTKHLKLNFNQPGKIFWLFLF